MIFDQNRGSERSWTNIDPVGVTILLPSEDFVLLNHSTFKPFECYSDRLLGKRINPLGLGPRESRFKSEVPDQFLWGSQAVRQLAVNQLTRRFESCPHSQQCRGRLLVEGPSPTKRCSRVRSSTPVPDDYAPVAEGIQASLF